MEYPILINGLEVNATFDEATIETILKPLLQKLTALQKEKNNRILVMLAAPPGAGKSTLASFLEYLSKQDPTLTPIQVIGMDGFHHYQDYLENHYVIKDGKEVNMVSIKGAPITFDLELFLQSIQLLEEGKLITWPIYDRMLHNPIENAITIDHNIILLEGNYLLIKEDGWEKVSEYATYTIFIQASLDQLRSRLIYRKAKGMAMHEAIYFVDHSDLVNCEYVLSHSSQADLNLIMVDDGKFEIQ